MTSKTIPYLFMAVFALGLSAMAFGTDITPPISPELFRESLHIHTTYPPSSDVPGLPEIYPGLSEKALSANFDDLLISETVGPANFVQQKADIVSLKGGRFAAVWEDNRFGPVGVFLQLFDGLTTRIGANSSLIVGNSYNISDPHICADTNGNFYVIWREDVRGFLQAARFDSTGALLTDVFFVSDTIFASYTGEFDATCLRNGKLVVTWENYTIGNDIAYRIFNTDGTPASDELKANSDGSQTKHWAPAISSGPGDEFAIVWEDYRSGTADIFFRRFNSLGTPYVAEFSLSDASARDSARFMPSLTFSSTDGYVAAWGDLRDGQNIYLQRLTTAGVLNGSNQLVSVGTSSSSNWDVNLAVNGIGRIMAVWTEYGDYNKIILQRFTGNVSPDGTEIIVSDNTEKLRFTPAVGANQIGNILVVWTDLISGKDIFGAGIGANGTALSSNFVVNDDNQGASSFEPVVTTFDRFEWDIAFTDMRRDAGDIMLQRVYIGGELVGSNRMINADPSGGFQSQPALSSGNDVLCVSWTDVRSDGINGQNIFCRFSKPHYDLTDEMVVNDDHAESAAHYTSANAINDNGVTLIVWTDTRQGNQKIFGQIYNADFTPLGNNFLIGPDATARIGEMPQVATDTSGGFIVTYMDRLASGGTAVEAKKVTISGTVSDLFAFQSHQSGYTIDGFDAGVTTNGAIALVWHGFGAGNTEIFLTMLNQNGDILQATQAITDNTASAPGMPTMTVDSDDYILITWLDNRTGNPTPFRQIYEPSLTPIQTNSPTYTTEGRYMQTPVGAGSHGKGIFVWADARSDGLNIYASQEIYAPTDADDEQILPSAYELKQNYPNPFNPSTTIQFSLPETGHVTLDVLNILGQRVKRLADETYSAGTHLVVWDGLTDDGTQTASGIYFYHISSNDFSYTRKMVLLK